MTPSIAVVYLARLAEGFDKFRLFSESYRDHPAEQEHDLVLLAKGFRKPGEYAALRALFADLPHQIISVRDDIGLDIHAYKAAAKQLKHSHVVFFNTFSEIAATGWLRKMTAHCLSEKVGAVAACGSFESLYDSIKVINKVGYLTINKTLIKSVAAFFRPVLKLPAVPWVVSRLRGKRLLSIADFSLRLTRLLSKKADHEFERLWADGASVGGPLSGQIRFPRFPNPHLRSNALMIDRSVFLRVPLKGVDKSACFEFESGYHGLSHTLLLDGLRLLVVGADGRGYDVADWPKSNTFRLDGQKNLLVHDNHTRKFARMGAAQKELHRTLTWGGYDTGARLEIVGLDFAAAQPIRDVGNFTLKNAHGHGLPMISVVVPTRKSGLLLNEVLATILKEPYPNYEVIIFDNASNPPVDIRQLPASNHIRVVRSDTLLDVTNSWNKAIDLAVGDYLILIEDDDGLCPRFFDRVAALVDEFEKPDLIYSAYYRFPHPGALPSHPTGYVAKEANAFFFRDRRYPFVMDQTTVKTAVSGSLRMRRNFGFDMQGMIFRRAFLESLRRAGNALHSPLPDCYIANVALAKAARIVVEPRPITIAGTSGSLVAGTHHERREKDGRDVSEHEITGDPAYSRCRDRLLPGSSYDSAYMLAMQHVTDAVGERFGKPDYARYRKMQILASIEEPETAGLSSHFGLGAKFWSRLSYREKIWAMRVGVWSKAFPGQLSSICKKLDQNAFTSAMIILAVGEYINTSEVHRALEKRAIV